MTYDDNTEFTESFEALQAEVHETAVNKGWWETDREHGTLLMLMVGELAEAMEAARKGNPPDSYLPQFDAITVELADTVIRIMDYAERYNLRVAEAIVAKAEYNKSRPHRHGGKAF
jgi:NTP pyrophosphatase (non-canonical NTP hydrolase)